MMTFLAVFLAGVDPASVLVGVAKLVGGGVVGAATKAVAAGATAFVVGHGAKRVVRLASRGGMSEEDRAELAIARNNAESERSGRSSW